MSTYDGKVKLSQTLHAPDIIAPDHLFGRSTHYPGNYYAVGQVGLMQIDKSTFMTFMQEEPIFLINLLNILSRRSQKNKETLLSMSSGDLRERLAYWILNLTSRNATDIRINARQRDLYGYFGVQRTALLNTLAEMKQDKIIDYTINEVTILDRAVLRDMLLEGIEFWEE
jgi:CRP-like cAMP-binding protein